MTGLPHATGNDGTPRNFEVLGTAPARLWETRDAPPMHESYIGELNWVAERLAAPTRRRTGSASPMGAP